MYAFNRLGLESKSDYWLPILHRTWAWQARKCLAGADIFHVMLHGTSLSLIKQARRRGAIVIGEAVNAHPDIYHAVQYEEHKKMQVPYPARLSKQLRLIVEEAKLCDYLLTPSKVVADSYVDRGFPDSKVKVLPYGVDLKAFRPSLCLSQHKTGKFIACCACQMIPRKGIRYIIEAWKKLNFSPDEAELRLIGVMPIKYTSLFNHLPRGVKYYGVMNRTSLSEALRQSSVFVLPTCEDGFAVVTLEAMASGCVVVTTYANGAAEIIQNGVDGFAVEPRSSEELGEILKRLKNHPEMCATVSANAIAKVSGCYTWESYAQKLIGFYQECLQQRNRL